MDIRPLTDTYAVSPQIEAEDMPAIADRGYGTIINNRPDAEVSPAHQSATLREAAERAGLEWRENPVANGAMTEDNVTAQREMLAEATGPVLAYCRSGTRSATVWAIGEAENRSAEAILGDASRGGYDLAGLRPMLEARRVQG